MKYILIVTILFLFSINAFSQIDSAKCKTEAIIKGFDITRCVCCGGWVVEINDTTYLCNTDLPGWEKPKAFSKEFVIFDEAVEFPIKVCLDYSQYINRCRRFIIINWLDRID